MVVSYATIRVVALGLRLDAHKSFMVSAFASKTKFGSTASFSSRQLLEIHPDPFFGLKGHGIVDDTQHFVIIIYNMY